MGKGVFQTRCERTQNFVQTLHKPKMSANESWCPQRIQYFGNKNDSSEKKTPLIWKGVFLVRVWSYFFKNYLAGVVACGAGAASTFGSSLAFWIVEVGGVRSTVSLTSTTSDWFPTLSTAIALIT